jgi:hypothetical protein
MRRKGGKGTTEDERLSARLGGVLVDTGGVRWDKKTRKESTVRYIRHGWTGDHGKDLYTLQGYTGGPRGAMYNKALVICSMRAEARDVRYIEYCKCLWGQLLSIVCGVEGLMYLFWHVSFRRARRLMVNFLVKNTKDLGSTLAGAPERGERGKATTFGPGESGIEQARMD